MNSMIQDVVGDDAAPPAFAAFRPRDCYLAAKPTIEFLAALMLLLATWPVLLVAAILVRSTSKGPVIYTQERTGRGGEAFILYKLRTMYVDSERDGPRWCVPGDTRVTPVGRLLRWLHVDELPQLVNVLRGEMSLVGPRPERPGIIRELERAFPSYGLRTSMRPGITGLAQVQQPPDVSLECVRRKLEYDLYYIDRAGFWMDLRVLVGTALKCLGVPFSAIRLLLGFPCFQPTPVQAGFAKIAFEPVLEPSENVA